MTLEQRQSSRIPVRLRVDCKPLSGTEVKDILDGRGYCELGFTTLALARPRQGMLPARIRDLSVGGLCMEGPLPLGMGDAATLDLHLPEERTALKALAEVVWSRPSNLADQPHACGLRFAALEEDGIRRLKCFLSKVTEGSEEPRPVAARS